MKKKSFIMKNEKKKKFEQKILMGYCPFCIVRKEILCCNIEIVLQAVGENDEKLYCNIVLYCDLKG